MNMEKIKQELSQYKDILSKDMYDYLNALINLDISVISSKYIDDDKRKELKKLDIYDKIKIFNIYYGTLNILNRNDIKYFKEIRDFDNFKIYALLNNKHLLVYNANFSLVKGYIDLYEQSFNMNVRKRARDKITKDLEVLRKYNYNNKNFYEIKRLENLLDNLREPYNLSSIDYNSIELSTKIFQLFLNEYNLNYKDFDKEIKTVKDKYLSRSLVHNKDEFNIYRNVKYL